MFSFVEVHNFYMIIFQQIKFSATVMWMWIEANWWSNYLYGVRSDKRYSWTVIIITMYKRKSDVMSQRISKESIFNWKVITQWYMCMRFSLNTIGIYCSFDARCIYFAIINFYHLLFGCWMILASALFLMRISCWTTGCTSKYPFMHF